MTVRSAAASKQPRGSSACSIEPRDIHAQFAALLRQLAGGQDLGRFTSPEAILAKFE
jgi:hypothetical protein